MKKFLVVIFSLFMIVGCKKNDDSVIKEFESKVNSLSNYHLIGEMDIVSNESKYTYSVDVVFKKGDYYKVVLTNKDNQHEQIILKNEEGVYVVTPSINKSFKFQSEWPSNSSQSYILEVLLSDVLADSDRSISLSNDSYTITSKVNYPNNSELVSEEITLDKEYLPSKIVVKDTGGKEVIKTIISKIDVKTKYDKKYFNLSNSIKETTSETSNELESVVYPMYLPVNTKYSGEEVITSTDKERVILTYTGEKPFIMIEEASNNKDHETTLVSGEVVQYGNVVGILTDTSLNWSNDGKEYYIIGESLSSSELLKIASSTQVTPISK